MFQVWKCGTRLFSQGEYFVRVFNNNKNCFFQKIKILTKIFCFFFFSKRVKQISDTNTVDHKLSTFDQIQIVTERRKLITEKKQLTEAEEKLFAKKTYYFLYEHFLCLNSFEKSEN